MKVSNNNAFPLMAFTMKVLNDDRCAIILNYLKQHPQGRFVHQIQTDLAPLCQRSSSDWQQSVVSARLGLLRQCHLLLKERHGRNVAYRVNEKVHTHLEQVIEAYEKSVADGFINK